MEGASLQGMMTKGQIFKVGIMKPPPMRSRAKNICIVFIMRTWGIGTLPKNGEMLKRDLKGENV